MNKTRLAGLALLGLNPWLNQGFSQGFNRGLPIAPSLAADSHAPFRVAELPASASGLDAAQLKQLRALNIRIMVPAPLPKGFHVYAVSTDHQPAGPGGGPGYKIAYAEDSSARMFAIEALSSGIGDPPADSETKVWNGQFGQIYALAQLPGKSLPQGESPFYLTSWIGKGPYYHLSSPAMVNRKLKPQPVSSREFNQLIQSLTWLKF